MNQIAQIRTGSRRFLPFVLVALLAAACRTSITPSDSQAIATESRSVAPFEALSAANAITVHGHVGPVQSVVVTAASDVLPHVLTVVSEGKLTIAMDGSLTQFAQVDVELTVTKVSTVEATTSADVTVLGVSADVIRLAATSSARIVATGSARTIEVYAASSARITLTELPAESARADVGTAADVEIVVADSVVGSVHESAVLRVHGRPEQVAVTESTSGRVIRED